MHSYPYRDSCIVPIESIVDKTCIYLLATAYIHTHMKLTSTVDSLCAFVSIDSCIVPIESIVDKACSWYALSDRANVPAFPKMRDAE